MKPLPEPSQQHIRDTLDVLLPIVQQALENLPPLEQEKDIDRFTALLKLQQPFLQDAKSDPNLGAEFYRLLGLEVHRLIWFRLQATSASLQAKHFPPSG